jgi:hypothetical protein
MSWGGARLSDAALSSQALPARRRLRRLHACDFAGSLVREPRDEAGDVGAIDSRAAR